jgi:hypothetical protein
LLGYGGALFGEVLTKPSQLIKHGLHLCSEGLAILLALFLLLSFYNLTVGIEVIQGLADVGLEVGHVIGQFRQQFRPQHGLILTIARQIHRRLPLDGVYLLLNLAQILGNVQA